MKNDTVICLPARYASSRLPGKPLIEIGGKALILHALESAGQIPCRQLLVATDDERIETFVKSHGYEVLMTSPDHQSGTDRIAEVSEKMGWSDDMIVVNYQGDEPQTPRKNIEQLIEALQNTPEAAISTLYQSIHSYEDLVNPNNVKLVTDKNNMALYFSRAAIPYSRDTFQYNSLDENITYKHHIGLYAYRAGFLKNFSKMTQSGLELTESLEQLRALSHGYKIVAVKAHEKMPHGIDTREDMDHFEQYLKLNF